MKNRVQVIAAWLAGAALVVSVQQVTAQFNTRASVPDPAYSAPADLTNPTAVRGCVIRFDELSASGTSVVPRIHSNTTHQCVGVTSVQADWTSGASYGDLRVYNSGGPGVVVSMSAEEDETLSALDIQCGPSGGGTLTRIRCYRDGVKIPVQSLDMYHPYANLWLSWIMWMPPAS